MELPRRDLKDGQYHTVPNQLLKKLQYPKRQKPYLIAVYCGLAAHANRKTFECFPSQETLAKYTGVSLRMVKRMLKDMEELRIIFVRREKRRLKTRNKYVLLRPDFWLSGAERARRSVHIVPSNKTQENKKIKYRKERNTELETERSRLIEKLSVHRSRSP